jgi:hypothetical protein
MSWRLPQFANYVSAQKTTEFIYSEGADASRFTRLFTSQEVEPDDTTFATSGCDGEDLVLSVVGARRWEELVQQNSCYEQGARISIKRRGIFQWIDPLRNILKIGNR